MGKTPNNIKKLVLLALFGLGALLLPTRAKAGGFVINGATVTLSNNTTLTVAEEITLTKGQLIANSAEIVIGSTWTLTNGSFSQGTSTVTFSPTGDIALAGSTTFYSLRNYGSGYTMRFTAGTTQYVTGAINLQDITLRSITNNATWYIRHSTGPQQTLLNLDVKDSNASGGRVMVATNTTNSGNNRNWSFPLVDNGERYWVGSAAGFWNNTANWALKSNGTGGAQVPLSSHTVIFDGAGSKNGNATVNMTVNIATLTVSGYTGTLNFFGYDISIATALYHDTGTINLSTSPVTLQGDLVRTGGNFVAGASTVTLSGNQNQTLTTNTTNFASVIVNKGGGTLSISDELIVTGQWTNTSGTTVDGSTVTFAGGRQQLIGSTTFYAVRALTSGTTLAFTAGTTQYATNMIDFENTLLMSTTNGSTWYFNFSGSSQTILNTDIQDSNARGGLMLYPNSTSRDMGNNSNWAFDTNSRYWVGDTAGSWSNATNWSYASNGTGGAAVPTSTHTAVFDGRGDTNGDASLFGNVTVTTVSIAGYAGSLNTQGYTLTVSSAFVQASGSVSLSTSTLDIQGDFTYTAGTFNASNSTATFTSTKNQTVTSNGVSFNSVVINKAGGTWSPADDVVLTGTFTYTAGTLSVNGDQITVGGDWRQNAAAITLTGSTVVFTGASSTLYGPTTFYALRALTPNTTLYVVRGTTQVVTSMLDLENIYLRSTTNNATWYFRFAGTDQTLINVDVRDSNANSGYALVPDAASADSGNNRNWVFGGDKRYWVRTTAGNWNSANSWAYSSGGAPIAPVPTSTHTVIFDGALASQGNATLNGNVTVATLTLSGYTTGTLALNGYTLTVSSALTQTSGIINLGSATLQLGGDLNRSGGTFTSSVSTVAFIGSGDQVINPFGTTFFTVDINKPSGTASLAGPLTMAGSLVIDNGTLDTTSSNYAVAVTSHVILNGGSFLMNDSTITVARNWTQAGGTTVVGGSSVTLTGGNTQLLSDASLNNIIINKTAATRAQVFGSFNAAGNFTMSLGSFTPLGYDVNVSSNFTQGGGAVYLGTSTLTIGGSAARTGGVFSADASTVTFTGGINQTMNTGAFTFFNVVVNKSAGSATPAVPLNVLGSLTLQSGTLDTTGGNIAITVSSHVVINGGVFTMNSSTIIVQKDWTYNAGTVSVGNSTVTFSGTNNQSITSNGSNFNTVEINKAGGTWSLADDMVLAGTFTYTAGTLNVNGEQITVGGDWKQNAAAITLTGSTVVFTGASSTLYGPTTFYALRALTPNTTLYVVRGTTQVVTSMLDLENIYLRSTTSNSTWYFRFAGSDQTLIDVDVRDSNANFGNILFPDPTSTDSGNNRNWAFTGDKRYWVRTTAGNWNSANSWAYSSGGAPIASVPTSTHTVIFDGYSGAQGNVTFNGNVTVATLTLSGYTTGTFALNGYTLTVSEAFTQTSGIVTLSSGTLNLGGTFDRTAGTFTAGTSTVAFTGSNDQTVNPANTSFFNVLINKSDGVASLAGALNLSGSLTINDSTLTTTSSNYPIAVTSHVFITGGFFDLNDSTMSLARDWTKSGGVFDAGGSTVDFVGGNTQNLISGGTHFFHLNVTKTAGTRLQLIGDAGVDGHFTVNQGTFTTQGYDVTVATNVNLVNGTIMLTTGTLSVGGQITRTAGTFSADASTVTLTGAADQIINTGGVNYFNMVVNKSGGTASLASAMNVRGSLTLVSGDFDTTTGNLALTVSSHVVISGGVFTMNASTIIVQKDWTYSSGTLGIGNSTVTFSGTNNQSITSNGSSFNTVEINKAGGTWSLADNMVLSGTFTYTAGTLNVNGEQITVGGDWKQNAAAIALTGSTVVFTGASSTLYGPTTFYALRALTANTTLYFVKGTTQVVTNMLDWENIYLRSTQNNATWYFRYSGTTANQTIDGVNVRDSNANMGNVLFPSGGSVDAGNNRNWDFSGPNAIANLTATVVSSTTIALTWTAPTDQQNPLTGQFAIQYATYSSASFAVQNAQILIPFSSLSPGTAQNQDVSGLAANTTHFFRIWTADSNTNWSSVSNATSAVTHAQWVSNIGIGSLYVSSITFSWTPLALSPSSFTAEGYHVLASTRSDFALLYDSATLTDVSQSTWTIFNLTGEVTYYFRIGSINWVSTASYAVDISTLISRHKELSLSTDTLTLGGLTNMNSQIIITTSVVVTNIGNVPATFEFRAATITVGSPWTISTSQGVDQYVLWAVINSTQPATANFANEDRLSNTFTPCTGSVFTMGNQDGVTVPAGTTRIIWFQLGTPTATTTGAAQSIQVKGRAN